MKEMKRAEYDSQDLDFQNRRQEEVETGRMVATCRKMAFDSINATLRAVFEKLSIQLK